MKLISSNLLAPVRLLTLALFCLSGSAHAAIEELPDDDLSQVSGSDGVTINLHLEWNANALNTVDLTKMSSISIGFYDATSDVHTYLAFQGFGGIVDFWGLRIDAEAGPVGVGDVINITMPGLIAFNQFGFRSMYAQTDLSVEPKSSYGKWIWNGAATVTGNVYIWPAK
ncbi:MAG TPA: DUF6160 family protein [Aquabacterium sp.]|nr:DUF6160 family protein [Aquabacterium sp.]